MNIEPAAQVDHYNIVNLIFLKLHTTLQLGFNLVQYYIIKLKCEHKKNKKYYRSGTIKMFINKLKLQFMIIDGINQLKFSPGEYFY